MALRGNTNLTLADWAKRLDGQGRVSQDIVELLSQSNEILDDQVWRQGNQTTGTRLVMRTGLPTAFWRLFNEGVAISKSRTAQVDERCGMLEAWSEIDAKLAELDGDVNATRLSEAIAFIEAMNQEYASTLFYGNQSVSQEEFTGFSIRYSDTTAANGRNIILGGGAGLDNSSIWLIGWGDHSAYGIFPQASKAGLQHVNEGKVTIETAGGSAEGRRLEVYREHWHWDCGLALKDWRYVARIPNIDVSLLVANGASAADLTNLMIKALHRLPKNSQKSTKRAFYMNATCFEFLDIQRREDVKDGGQLAYSVVDGVAQMSFRGIPIRQVDALTEAEALVA